MQCVSKKIKWYDVCITVYHIGYYKLLSTVGITWQDAPVSQYAALLQDYKVRDAPLYQSCSFFLTLLKSGAGSNPCEKRTASLTNAFVKA